MPSLDGTYEREKETKNSWRYQLTDGFGPDTIYVRKDTLRHVFGQAPLALTTKIEEKEAMA